MINYEETKYKITELCKDYNKNKVQIFETIYSYWSDNCQLFVEEYFSDLNLANTKDIIYGDRIHK